MSSLQFVRKPFTPFGIFGVITDESVVFIVCLDDVCHDAWMLSYLDYKNTIEIWILTIFREKEDYFIKNIWINISKRKFIDIYTQVLC